MADDEVCFDDFFWSFRPWLDLKNKFFTGLMSAFLDSKDVWHYISIVGQNYGDHLLYFDWDDDEVGNPLIGLFTLDKFDIST